MACRLKAKFDCQKDDGTKDGLNAVRCSQCRFSKPKPEGDKSPGGSLGSSTRPMPLCAQCHRPVDAEWKVYCLDCYKKLTPLEKRIASGKLYDKQGNLWEHRGDRWVNTHRKAGENV